jgi:ABC-type transport system involved in multi-copper enzyme maturation permease subunit
VTAVGVIMGYALRESLRRRVFVVVLVLTVGFLVLYGIGAWRVFRDTEAFARPASRAGVDTATLAGSNMFGLAMFATLFLGCVLAVFLTLGAVRGDAERGLLQPLVVRPIGRPTLLLGRFAGAATVCAAYVLFLYVAALLITGFVGDWWPDRIVGPALGLMLGVCIIAAIGLLGSVQLSGTANGIAIFMVFGAGLVAGLLGQIGNAIESPTLEDVSRVSTWLLPFEALYQSGLAALTADARGVTEQVVSLGPFGGAHEASPIIWVWSAVYLALVGVAALVAFRRRDL